MKDFSRFLPPFLFLKYFPKFLLQKQKKNVLDFMLIHRLRNNLQVKLTQKKPPTRMWASGRGEIFICFVHCWSPSLFLSTLDGGWYAGFQLVFAGLKEPMCADPLAQSQTQTTCRISSPTPWENLGQSHVCADTKWVPREQRRGRQDRRSGNGPQTQSPHTAPVCPHLMPCLKRHQLRDSRRLTSLLF